MEYLKRESLKVDILERRINESSLAQNIKNGYKKGVSSLLNSSLSDEVCDKYLDEMYDSVSLQTRLVESNREKIGVFRRCLEDIESISDKEKADIFSEYKDLVYQNDNYGIKLTLKEVYDNITDFDKNCFVGIYKDLNQILNGSTQRFYVLDRRRFNSTDDFSESVSKINSFNTEINRELEEIFNDSLFTDQEKKTYLSGFSRLGNTKERLLFIINLSIVSSNKKECVNTILKLCDIYSVNNDRKNYKVCIDRLKECLSIKELSRLEIPRFIDKEEKQRNKELKKEVTMKSGVGNNDKKKEIDQTYQPNSMKFKKLFDRFMNLFGVRKKIGVYEMVKTIRDKQKDNKSSDTDTSTASIKSRLKKEYKMNEGDYKRVFRNKVTENIGVKKRYYRINIEEEADIDRLRIINDDIKENSVSYNNIEFVDNRKNIMTTKESERKIKKMIGNDLNEYINKKNINSFKDLFYREIDKLIQSL